MEKQEGARPHFEYLDALRGIAVLGVLLVHSALATHQKGIVWELAFTGQRGVQLFYVVSAFTLCLTLDSARRESSPLLNFFIRRFFRIAPLFYVAILANILLHHFAPSRSPLTGLTFVEVASGFVFLNGFDPYGIATVAIGGWSVAVETTFYLFLPFLHSRFRTCGYTGPD